ncbi:MAG: PorV/PorQ family protein [Elusimicrobia bacterium]|nr:PorV/PorQ family protein [Elusimicrobiota bacterium]
MRIPIFVIAFLGAFLRPPVSSAAGLTLLDWSPGVRAEGMGGAFAAVADDAGALFWNPAGLNQLPLSEVAFSHTEDFGDQSRNDLRLVRPAWWGQERRTWGARVAHASVKSFDLVEDGAVTGSAGPQETLVAFSFAQPVGPLSAGVTAKAIRQDLTTESGQTWGVDLGALGRQGRWSWGVGLNNLGPNLKIGTSSVGLHPSLRLGGAGVFGAPKRPGGRSPWLVTGQVEPFEDGTVRSRLGVEFAPLPMGLRVRVGYRSLHGADSFLDTLVFGAGFEKGRFQLNYAFLPGETVGDSHRLDVSVRFGERLPEEARLEEQLALAEKHFKAKQMVKARETLREVFALSPSNDRAKKLSHSVEARFSESLDPETLLILGDQAFKEGRFEAAADFFRKLLEVQPDHREARALYDSAEARAGAARLAQAAKTLQQEQRREQDDRRRRARRFMDKEEWASALDQWLSLLELVPDSKEAQAGASSCREALYQDAEKARRNDRLEEALRLYQASRAGGMNYKDSAVRAKDIERSLQTKRQERSNQLFEQAVRAYDMKDLAKALNLFEQAARLAPEDNKIQRALERVRKEIGTKAPRP